MTRDKLDRFFTPDPLAERILADCIADGLIHPSVCTSVLEPSSGGGAFVRAVRQLCPAAMVTAIDLDPGARQAIIPGDPGQPGGQIDFVHADFRIWEEATRGQGGKFDLVIGNPPFGEYIEGRALPRPCALEHVEAGLRCLRPTGKLVFLLRGSFLSGRARYRRLFAGHKPLRVRHLVQRPSFTPDGATDLHDYVVIVMGASGASECLADWLNWK